jgi:hypothetical protein
VRGVAALLIASLALRRVFANGVDAFCGRGFTPLLSGGFAGAFFVLWQRSLALLLGCWSCFHRWPFSSGSAPVGSAKGAIDRLQPHFAATVLP